VNDIAAFTQLLKDVAVGIVLPSPQAVKAAAWIRELKTAHAMTYYLIMSFLYSTPVEVIQALGYYDNTVRGLERNEQALRFVTVLQEQLR
jgi:hypothetical protein